jgi:hypothetical protein
MATGRTSGGGRPWGRARARRPRVGADVDERIRPCRPRRPTVAAGRARARRRVRPWPGRSRRGPRRRRRDGQRPLTVCARVTAANAEDNGLAVRAVRCEWRDPTPLELDGPWDLVLGSDVLYDDSSARHLLALLGRVVAPAGEVWLADPGRPPASSFLAAASTYWQLSGRACSHGVRLHRLVRKPHPPAAQARTVTQTQ